MREELSLANLQAGAVIERFDNELANLYQNIADPNCPAITVRKVLLEVSIKPTRDREMGTLTCKVTSKLAGVEPTESRIDIDDEGDGTVRVYEAVKAVKTQPLPFEDIDNVTPIRGTTNS
jgi:hypothetical protein